MVEYFFMHIGDDKERQAQIQSRAKIPEKQMSLMIGIQENILEYIGRAFNQQQPFGLKGEFLCFTVVDNHRCRTGPRVIFCPHSPFTSPGLAASSWQALCNQGWHAIFKPVTMMGNNLGQFMMVLFEPRKFRLLMQLQDLLLAFFFSSLTLLKSQPTTDIL